MKKPKKVEQPPADTTKEKFDTALQCALKVCLEEAICVSQPYVWERGHRLVKPIKVKEAETRSFHAVCRVIAFGFCFPDREPDAEARLREYMLATAREEIAKKARDRQRERTLLPKADASSVRFKRP